MFQREADGRYGRQYIAETTQRKPQVVYLVLRLFVQTLVAGNQVLSDYHLLLRQLELRYIPFDLSRIHFSLSSIRLPQISDSDALIIQAPRSSAAASPVWIRPEVPRVLSRQTRTPTLDFL